MGAVPFQLVEPGRSGTAGKGAGQHGVLLYRAFNLTVIAENPTAQKAVVADHLDDIIFSLRVALSHRKSASRSDNVPACFG